MILQLLFNKNYSLFFEIFFDENVSKLFINEIIINNYTLIFAQKMTLNLMKMLEIQLAMQTAEKDAVMLQENLELRGINDAIASGFNVKVHIGGSFTLSIKVPMDFGTFVKEQYDVALIKDGHLWWDSPMTGYKDSETLKFEKRKQLAEEINRMKKLYQDSPNVFDIKSIE